MQLIDIQSRVVYTAKELSYWETMVTLLGSGEAQLIADVETYGTDPKNGKLLGIALCHPSLPSLPLYVALQWYDFRLLYLAPQPGNGRDLGAPTYISWPMYI
jgi:hypothetical protein